MLRRTRKVDVIVPAKTVGDVNRELLQILKSADWVSDLHVTVERPLSLARRNAVLACKSEWVAMIDADVTVPKRWFHFLEPYLAENVGAVATVSVDNDADVSAYELIVKTITPLEKVETSPYINNVLVRRSVMEDYNPPRLFHGEDLMLKKHVESKGLKWIVLGDVGARHYGKVGNKVESGAAYRKYGHYSMFQLVRRFMARLILSPYAALARMSVTTLWYLTRDNVQFFAGYFKELLI
jgi:hypothetical protein